MAAVQLTSTVVPLTAAALTLAGFDGALVSCVPPTGGSGQAFGQLGLVRSLSILACSASDRSGCMQGSLSFSAFFSRMQYWISDSSLSCFHPL